MGWEPGQLRTPKALFRELHADIADMRAKIKGIEADLAMFRDLKQLKIWLKTYRIIRNDVFVDPAFY